MASVLKDKKVLIAEDEAVMLNALAEAFASEGSAVLTAENGEVAFDTALREKPDIILLDILMPKASGMDVLGKLRGSGDWGKGVPVIMLTNLSSNDQIMSGIVKNEPSFYLVKTEWTLEEVVEKAKQCLEQPAKR